MLLKQLTVLIENSNGRFEQVSKILAENDINIICMNLSDTSDYGSLRMIVKDHKTAIITLKENGYPVITTEVFAVEIPQIAGKLHKMTTLLSKENIDIEYLYPFNSTGASSSIIIKTSDNNKSIDILKENDFTIMTHKYIYG